LKELHERLSERQREEEKVRFSIEDAQTLIGRLNKDEQSEQTNIQRIDEEIEIKEKEKERHKQRLLAACHSAFKRYLDDLWSRLLNLISAEDAMKEKTAARDNLRKARHEDPEIASLCEAREEWTRILSSAVISSVKATAKTELDKIKLELDRRFPGALEVDEKLTTIGEMEELFYLPSWQGSALKVFLPIPVPTFESLNSSETQTPQKVAMQLIWSIVQSWHLRADNSCFQADGIQCVLKTQTPETEIARTPVSLQLPAGSSVSFIMSQLPNELMEALAHENSDT